ncbi:MAG TPA: HK97 family phage prohead protease [Aquihabitans sp.]|nr:HK97 family phage prohead protease [Aquihabitans sp.]
MARALPNLQTRTVTVDTGKRAVDIPVDGAGHLRRAATLVSRSVTRAAGGDGPIGFKGHAAVFDTRVWIGSKRWGFWEEMAPGCFNKTLGEADVRFLHNHNPDLVLARRRLTEPVVDTLRLAEDEVGLDVDADMAPTTYAKDLAISLDRRDVTQMSFAFDMVAYEWSYLADGTELLRHTEVALSDVSTVTYPAYVDTDAALRLDALAAARAAGWDTIDIDALATRLANPDVDTLAALRSIARGTTPGGPASATRQDTNEPPSGTRSDGPPAETTGDPEDRSTDLDPGDRLRDLRFHQLTRDL